MVHEERRNRTVILGFAIQYITVMLSNHMGKVGFEPT
jgi:hypothetical protein